MLCVISILVKSAYPVLCAKLKPNDGMWTDIYIRICIHYYTMTSTRATDPYFFAHMCISFPVIVSESNKTADATCPCRKTKANKFRAARRHTE